MTPRLAGQAPPPQVLKMGLPTNRQCVDQMMVPSHTRQYTGSSRHGRRGVSYVGVLTIDLLIRAFTDATVPTKKDWRNQDMTAVGSARMSIPRRTQQAEWDNRCILVTGATGFIASHLVNRLAKLGAKVHVVSRQASGKLGDVVWHQADLADAEDSTTLIDVVAPDVVFHLAGLPAGARHIDFVQPTFAANLQASVNLMVALVRRTPSARLVVAGSIEERQRADGPPPTPYAMSKIAQTAYCLMFARLYKLSVCVLRVAMVYGPAQADPNKLIPYVISAFLRKEAPRLSTGSRLIDWVYVEDVVDAFLLAAQSEACVGQAIDIGSGMQISIKDTVALIAKIVGSVPEPQYGSIPDRPFDFDQFADIQQASQLLCWEPSTSLDAGLRRSVDWYDSNRFPPADDV
jgi:UDP-glucose 4-epimerase